MRDRAGVIGKRGGGAPSYFQHPSVNSSVDDCSSHGKGEHLVRLRAGELVVTWSLLLLRIPPTSPTSVSRETLFLLLPNAQLRVFQCGKKSQEWEKNENVLQQTGGRTGTVTSGELLSIRRGHHPCMVSTSDPLVLFFIRIRCGARIAKGVSLFCCLPIPRSS